MVYAVARIEAWIDLVLFVTVLAMSVYSFADAAMRPAKAFTAGDKLTKQAWLLILGLAVVASLVFRSPISFFGLIASAPAGVYLADVRPRLAALTRRR